MGVGQIVTWVKFFVRCSKSLACHPRPQRFIFYSLYRCGRAFSSSCPTWAVSLSVLRGFVSCPHPPKLGTQTPESFVHWVGATLLPSAPFSLSLPVAPPLPGVLSALLPARPAQMLGLEPSTRDNNRSRKEAGEGRCHKEKGAHADPTPPPISMKF